MKIVKGDLIQMAMEGKFDVIVHGCNCMHTMGAGIAKQVKAKLPEAYDADLATRRGDRSKLGAFSSVVVARGGFAFTVVNAYTQYDWRGMGIKVDYDAVARAFNAIAREWHGSRIAYPMIGAGYAGGDWNKISAIIDEALSGLNHTLVVLEK